MPQPMPETIAFDDVVIDFVGRRLLRGGTEQAVEPKAFAALALLAGSPGRVFTRDEILDSVWGHRHVTQSVLNRTMSLLRQALGEDAQHPKRLSTVHGVGYRLDLPPPAPKAEVAGTNDPAPDLAPRDPPPPLPPSAAGPVQKRWPWKVALGALVLLGVAAALELQKRQGTSIAPSLAPAASASTRPSLAVLPFVDLSQLRDQEYLADGLAEEILGQLSQVPALQVVGRTSSFSFKGKNEDLRAIGRQLGVAHLLEGSVRKDGDRLRVTAQLIRAEDGTHLWSKTYARELRDVFAVEDEISRDVAQALSVKLDAVRFNREQGGTTNVEAYERFLRARSLVMRELYDFEHRRERLQLAREMVALDPRCVLCLDALASSLNSMSVEVDGVQAAQLRAEGAEVRARIARIAPDSWVAKRDRSNALWVEGKRAEAIALAKEIVNAGPPTKERVFDYAFMIYAMGHLNETIALVEQVRAVEPMAIFLSRDLQYDYTAARRYQDAEAEYQRGLRMEGSQREPTMVAFLRQLAGKRPGGLAELRTLHRELLNPAYGFDTPFLRDLGKVLNDRSAMLALARKALADETNAGSINVEYLPFVADALGDADLAVAALRRLLETFAEFKTQTMSQYTYSALWNLPYSRARSHPEYKKLLTEMGVVDYWRQTGKWGDGCEAVGTDDFRCE
jgi:TolB-like protein/DNA-binding winged helix-turn-helix (wHTH) protein/tetratricopeptide (TPR) repeat protein